MTLKLTDRARVKDILTIPTADARQDMVINALIEKVSEETEFYTRRKFTYGQYTEYYESYEQMAIDADPQIVLVDAKPIDTSQPLTVEWSPYNFVDRLIITLDQSRGDFDVDAEKGKITIHRMGVLTTNIPLFGGIYFTYAQKGFRVKYTGGYKSKTPSPAPDPTVTLIDPLDDYDVLDVPLGLKLVVARKVADDYNIMKNPINSYSKRGVIDPATMAKNVFLEGLKQFQKKDRLL